MRPHRLELTNQLILGYGLHEQMSMHAPRKATEEELCTFHDGDYVDFLKRSVVSLSFLQFDSNQNRTKGDAEECPSSHS